MGYIESYQNGKVHFFWPQGTQQLGMVSVLSGIGLGGDALLWAFKGIAWDPGDRGVAYEALPGGNRKGSKGRRFVAFILNIKPQILQHYQEEEAEEGRGVADLCTLCFVENWWECLSNPNPGPAPQISRTRCEFGVRGGVSPNRGSPCIPRIYENLSQNPNLNPKPTLNPPTTPLTLEVSGRRRALSETTQARSRLTCETSGRPLGGPWEAPGRPLGGPPLGGPWEPGSLGGPCERRLGGS